MIDITDMPFIFYSERCAVCGELLAYLAQRRVQAKLVCIDSSLFYLPLSIKMVPSAVFFSEPRPVVGLARIKELLDNIPTSHVPATPNSAMEYNTLRKMQIMRAFGDTQTATP